MRRREAPWGGGELFLFYRIRHFGSPEVDEKCLPSPRWLFEGGGQQIENFVLPKSAFRNTRKLN